MSDQVLLSPVSTLGIKNVTSIEAGYCLLIMLKKYWNFFTGDQGTKNEE